MKDYDGGMVTSVNQSDFVKTALRLPPDVHVRLHEAAQANGRSYNAEIVARLAASFHPHADTEALQREIEHLQARVDEANHVTGLLTMMQKFLAGVLVKAIDRMSAELQKEYTNVRLLATSMETDDARGIGAAFIKIIGADPDPVRGLKDIAEVKQVMADLEPTIAAKPASKRATS